MNTNMLALASSLSDHELLDRLAALAVKERTTSAEMVAHLAALIARPSLHAAKGYGSLFAYCTEALRLSEDAACNRITAAKTCRRFPAILESLASGAIIADIHPPAPAALDGRELRGRTGQGQRPQPA